MLSWIYSFLSLLFPRYCVVCGDILPKGASHLCLQCDIDMPRTNFHLTRDNKLEMLLWGRMDIERAASYFHYAKGSPYSELLFQLKYHGRKELGYEIGKCMANEIYESGFFDSVDVIIPVPLHKKKHKQRGYNQSEQIANGISRITGIPVASDYVVRKKHTQTQTRKSNYERIENMEDAFDISSSCPYERMHVLLVDDIITTGATIVACGNELQRNRPDIKISVLTIGFAS